MITKDQLRKKFLTLRKKKYYEVSSDKFNQLINYIKKKYKFKKKIFIALYYPSNFEINIFQTLNNLKSFKSVLLLPKIQDGNSLEFIEWNTRDILLVNKFGIPEPIKKQKSHLPDFHRQDI